MLRRKEVLLVPLRHDERRQLGRVRGRDADAQRRPRLFRVSNPNESPEDSVARGLISGGVAVSMIQGGSGIALKAFGHLLDSKSKSSASAIARRVAFVTLSEFGDTLERPGKT